MTLHPALRERLKGDLRRVTSHPYFGFVLLGFAMLLLPILKGFGVDVSVSLMRAFGYTMIYVIIGLGFSILLGYAGLASLGTAGFVGVGTYVIGYMTSKLGLSAFAGILVAIAGAIVLGAVVGFISLRIEGMYLAIITLGLSEILNEVFKNAVEITGGTNGLSMRRLILFGTQIDLDPEKTFVYLAIAMVFMMMLTLNLIKSPTGRAMLAMKNSESAAQAMGVSILRYRLIAFIVATVYAVVGGLLYMTFFEFSIPTTWSLSFSLNILAAVIVGGAQSIWGIALGTFMIFGLNIAVLQQIDFFKDNPAITLMFNGILIVLVVMFYPGGLIRLVATAKLKLDALYRRLRKKWRDYRYGEDPR